MASATHASDHATSRLEALWGPRALARTRSAVVMVLGAGGVGSNCIEALVRGGVGCLIVIDGDEVAASNINRQAIAFADTVGERKVDAVRAFVRRINPDVRIVTRDTFLLPDQVAPLIEACRAEAGGRIDYLVDAIDTVATKLEVARVADELGIPLLSSMGGAMKVDPAQLRFADIYETSGDALARVIRKGCRKRGLGRLEVLYSTEPAREAPSDLPERGDAGDGRAPLGTTSYLPPIMGQMLAGRVLARLADTSATPEGTPAPAEVSQ